MRRLLQQFRFGLGLPSCNHAILRCCTLSGSRVPKTSRAGRRSGTADVIRHYAAEPEDAIELGRASRHYEPECARDLAFESATELEFIKLRETQIEHDEIDPF